MKMLPDLAGIPSRLCTLADRFLSIGMMPPYGRAIA